mmetsp:Transcript_5045/g.6674  ORF Transcript_5045/g.6674 Transcript_5045/m.6674 type:complete len:87 (+) Transcript_5045:1656-1916(+)
MPEKVKASILIQYKSMKHTIAWELCVFVRSRNRAKTRVRRGQPKTYMGQFIIKYMGHQIRNICACICFQPRDILKERNSWKCIAGT